MDNKENKLRVMVKAINGRSITLKDPNGMVEFDWPLEYINLPFEIGNELFLELKNTHAAKTGTKECPSKTGTEEDGHNIKNFSIKANEEHKEELKRKLLEEMLN